MQQFFFAFSFSPVWQQNWSPPEWWLSLCCFLTAGRPLNSPVWAQPVGKNCADWSGSPDSSSQTDTPEGEIQITILNWTIFNATRCFNHKSVSTPNVGCFFWPLCEIRKWTPTGVGSCMCSLRFSLWFWLELSFSLLVVSRKEINSENSVGVFRQDTRSENKAGAVGIRHGQHRVRTALP